MNKKWVTLAGLGVLLLGGGIWAYQHFTAKPASASVILGKVQKGDVRKVITATGTVNYQQAIPLTFQQAGKLTALHVKAGDPVKQGQVLAELDSSDLENAVKQAQANVLSAQAKLQQTLDSLDSTVLGSVAKAQQEVAGTQQALVNAQGNADAGYLANQVNLAEQNVLVASNNLASASAKAPQSGNTSAVQAAQTALTQARFALDNARYQQNGGAAQALAQAQAAYDSAQADLAQAEAQLQKKQQGVPSTDVLAAQSTLSSAQTQLATAQKNLANATLTAPADGIVTTVAVQNYQNVSGTTAIMTWASGSNALQIDTAVDQADVSQVKVGQKADITLDSQPDQHISGTVTLVAVQGTTVQNVTTFNVTVQVDSPSSLLRAGMNANVSLILAETKDVLTVPSEAIRGTGARAGVLVPGPAADGSSGSTSTGKSRSKASVNGGNNEQGISTGSGSEPGPGAGTGTGAGAAVASGAGARPGTGSGVGAGVGANLNGVNAHFVPVEVGLNDGTNAEIKSGLTDGQEIVIGVRSTSTAQTSTGFGPNSGGSSGSNPGKTMGQLNRATGGR